MALSLDLLGLGLDFRGLLLVLVVFLLMLHYLKKRPPQNYPPGPRPLPVLGNVLSLGRKPPYLYFTKLSETFGPVFSFRFGSVKFVFVCGFEMVKEVLFTKGESFVDHPYSAMTDRPHCGTAGGVFFCNGEVWRRQRRFAVSTLRTFGLGKSRMERCIQQEILPLCDEIQTYKGVPFNPTPALNNAVGNIICELVMGRRFQYRDGRFQRLLQLVGKTLRVQGSIWGRLYDTFPAVMRYLPGPHNKMFKNVNEVLEFISEEVERHKRQLDHRDPQEPQDYIDTFIQEMEKHRDSELGFTEKNLALCVLDLFFGGTETTSTTLQWALLFFCKYPHVQEQAHAEIDRVIGRSRLPSMSDRVLLPYTDAVLHEVQRVGNIIPLGGARMATKDTTLGGYVIPKGTAVMMVLTSVLFDKTQWETPDQFNPGHFQDKDGKFRKREAMIPFSAGKRVCLGEGLARMEIFLFLVGLLQRFQFCVPDGETLSTEGVSGTTLSPKPYRFYAKVRG